MPQAGMGRRWGSQTHHAGLSSLFLFSLLVLLNKATLSLLLQSLQALTGSLGLGGKLRPMTPWCPRGVFLLGLGSARA